MSTRFEQRLDDGNLRNYGRLVIELASTVPDGLVVFFVSYSYMDYVIARWHEDGLLAELINHKLIFIETQVCACVYVRVCQVPGAGVAGSRERGYARRTVECAWRAAHASARYYWLLLAGAAVIGVGMTSQHGLPSDSPQPSAA